MTALLLSAPLLFGCAHAPVPTLALEWTDVDGTARPSGAMATALARTPLRIEPLVDQRTPPDLIGRHDNPKTEIHTPTNVAEFCTSRLRAALEHGGAKLVDSGEMATLRGEVLVYNVTEDNDYRSDVRIHFTVVQGDKVIYDVIYSGGDKTWGITHSPKNFHESLNNALQRVYAQLLTDDALAAALGVPRAGATAP